METSEVLNRAADLIEQRGWATGNCGMKTTGPACLEGAIAAVIDVPTCIKYGKKSTANDLDEGDEFYMYTAALNTHPAYRAMHEHLARGKDTCLFPWNDAPGRTGAEVIAALRAAAVIEAARETEARILGPKPTPAPDTTGAPRRERVA